RRLQHVHRLAQARREHRGLEAIGPEDLYRVTHNLHPVQPGVIQPAAEGADVGGAGLRRQQRLVSREDERGVDRHSSARARDSGKVAALLAALGPDVVGVDPLRPWLVRKPGDRLQPGFRDGDLGQYVRRPGGDLARLSIIPSTSVETVSALTGPWTMWQIS